MTTRMKTILVVAIVSLLVLVVLLHGRKRGDIFDQIHAAASIRGQGSFTPPRPDQWQGPARTGGFTPPPVSSWQGPAPIDYAALAKQAGAVSSEPAPLTTGSDAAKGRYGLVAGSFTAVLANETTVGQGIFRIDTATGQTWRYTTGRTKEGQFFERWILVPQN